MQAYSTKKFVSGVYQSKFPLTPTDFDSSLTASARDGANLTTGGTANTKGNWTQYIASTSQDAYALSLGITWAQSGTNRQGLLLDVGIGATGSETVVIPNIVCGFATQTLWGQWHRFNGLYIPAGSRVAVRGAATVTSSPVTTLITLDTQIAWPPNANALINYGADTSNSRGTLVTSGSGAFGSWTSLGTTAQTHSLYTLCAGYGTSSSTTTASRLWQVGYGPNTSTVTIVGTFRQTYVGGIAYGQPEPQFGAAPIPSGTNIYVRCAAEAALVLDAVLLAA